jgi:hypothetical protein
MSYLDDRSSPPTPYDRLWDPSRWDTAALDALARRATKREIAERLALLLKSFPNAGAADAEVYGGMLLQDVADTGPTIGDIEEACRQIRGTSKFLPVIAEVLEVLAECKYQRLSIVRHAQVAARSITQRHQRQIGHRQTADLSNLPQAVEADLLPF